MTDQNDSRPGGTRPATYREASGCDWDIVKAQARYEELEILQKRPWRYPK